MDHAMKGMICNAVGDNDKDEEDVGDNDNDDTNVD